MSSSPKQKEEGKGKHKWICGKCEQEEGKYPQGERIPEHSLHCPKRTFMKSFEEKKIKEEGKRIIALFGYPIDNSVRAKIFNSMPDVYEEAEKWKKISYLIVAFECKGEIFLFNNE